MKYVAITQRIDFLDSHQEHCDALDQRWWMFLKACDLVPIIIPNDDDLAQQIINNVSISGIILSGGNETSEREAIEIMLIEKSMQENVPLLGICHGMQVIQRYFGISLKKVSNHVQPQQEILINGNPETVNSYHEYGTRESTSDLLVFANAYDGVIKGIKHHSLPIIGIMWHPERMSSIADRDIDLVNQLFNKIS